MPQSSLKIDKRTKNGKRLDVAEVIKLREVQGLPFNKIGKLLGFSESYLNRSYKKFKNLLQDTDLNNDYIYNRTNILNSIELNLLQDLASPDKRKKASLNNTAYAFDKIHTARRLEEGKATAGGVSVSIEIAYQAATDQAKQLRLRHAGASTTVDIDKNEPDD